ncbi:MAG TPA: hypothetical protein VGB70_06595 [Allosphingosinicella sp.]|jgi:hypothetical protein
MSETRRPPHAALPARCLVDRYFTLLHYRTLHCIALHDRMSTVTGKGQGCTLGRDKMRALIGCDNTSLSKALSHLREEGYIAEERCPRDGRNKIYRVLYPVWESWMGDQKEALETWPIRQHPRKQRAKQVGSRANGASNKLAAEAEKVGSAPSRNGAKLRRTATQYEAEDDSVETDEYHSAEAGRLSAPVGSDMVDREAAERLALLESKILAADEGIDLASELRWLDYVMGVELPLDSKEFQRADLVKAEIEDILASATERSTAFPMEGRC